MDLQLDPNVIQEALQENIDKAIQEAFSSYEIGRQIREQVAERVVGEMLIRALDAAIPQLDIDRIATALAQEIQRNTVASVIRLLEEQTVATLLKLRGIPTYEKEAEGRARAEILNGLRAVKSGLEWPHQKERPHQKEEPDESW